MKGVRELADIIEAMSVTVIVLFNVEYGTVSEKNLKARHESLERRH